MSQQSRLDRRTFLRRAGLTALAGTVGTTTPLPALTTGGAQPRGTPYDFDTIYDRVGTHSSKWDAQIARYGREHIDVGMGTADQDFPIAPQITRALRDRIAHENYGYMTLPESYLESIVEWNRRRYRLEIDPETILHASGVHPGIISTLRAFCPPGSKVLLQTPSYNGFYTDIRIVGVVAEESPLKLVNGRYGMDFEDLERRIDHDTHALILCNPQNPTGNVWSRSDLTTLGEICTRRRVVVLADEIHCDFVTRGHTYTPYATLDDEAIVRNSITYKSVSKSFNLSAMKCAYLFSTNPDYLARIRGAGQHQQSMNTLGVIAAQTAYNECEDWLDQLIAYIDGTHQLVESMVRSTVRNVGFVKPEGTYLAWLDVSDALDRIGAEDTAAASEQTTPETVLQRYLVEHANIHINPGSSYGLGGSGHMRMNIATSRQLVELALGNMAAALARA
ncbi:MAG: aminotransferase class I/II-fold pyridoxal phosphate-dependent enzyme [Vicinamibacterales bacterium]|jgi:cystathionine beta-lyase|nr:aminotransferase class I/II-fold pyridoxal phosphate-dependent enzyme [Vicinamibacterales bacterium]